MACLKRTPRLGVGGLLAASFLISSCGSDSGLKAIHGSRDGGPPATADASEARGPADTTADTRIAVEAADLPVPISDAPAQVVDAPIEVAADAPAQMADSPNQLTPVDAPTEDSDAPQCRVLPGPDTSDGGVKRWVWRYTPEPADLWNVCDSYGSIPKLILEVVVKGYPNPRAGLPYCTANEVAMGATRACAVADAFRFVADCDQADMLIELPTDQPALEAYVHVESRNVTSSPRQMATVASQCERLLLGGVSAWTGQLDGGLPGPEAGAAYDAGDGGACGYPGTSRIDTNGKTLWWYSFDWRQDDLADICSSYGDGAKMVVEFRDWAAFPPSTLPACTEYQLMGVGDDPCAFGYRLETDCMAGQVLFEASTYSGYFHIESPRFPNPPRRLLGAERTCQRSLHPFFMPMAPAGSPNVGVATLTPSTTGYDPSGYGQPCQLNSDCPSGFQHCFIDAVVTDCLSGPLGRCHPNPLSNCEIYPGCGCARWFGGTICGSAPGTSCGNVSATGVEMPSNPQMTELCQACVYWNDGGVK